MLVSFPGAGPVAIVFLERSDTDGRNFRQGVDETATHQNSGLRFERYPNDLLSNRFRRSAKIWLAVSSARMTALPVPVFAEVPTQSGSKKSSLFLRGRRC